MMQKKENFIKRFWGYLKDKMILLIAIVVAVAITFSIARNLFHSFSIRSEIAVLEQEQEYFQAEVSRDSALIEQLNNDYELEKYAREKYFMRRSNEDIYIIK